MSTNGFAPIPSATKSFRFQAAWLNHSKFEEFMSQNWQSSALIAPFLREFARKWIKWNKEVFYNIFHKKDHLMARLKVFSLT